MTRPRLRHADARAQYLRVRTICATAWGNAGATA
jgi:hypothetical protein